MPHRWKPNVTVAAVVERDGRFLLVEEQTSEGLKLNNPAGHLDPGETLVQACARETLEETAHVFQPQALVGVYMTGVARPRRDADAPSTVTYLRFAFCGALGELLVGRRLDHGIVRTLWMTPEEIRASASRHRSPVVVQCVQDYLAGARYPLELLRADPAALAFAS
jgi:ADP-ribose pyrophosphatase YjhB (NUDIX family)